MHVVKSKENWLINPDCIKTRIESIPSSSVGLVRYIVLVTLKIFKGTFSWTQWNFYEYRLNMRSGHHNQLSLHSCITHMFFQLQGQSIRVYSRHVAILFCFYQTDHGFNPLRLRSFFQFRPFRLIGQKRPMEVSFLKLKNILKIIKK